MAVLDASAAIELLLGTPIGRSVARRISDPAVPLHAPHLLVVEVAQALRRLVAAGLMSSSRGELALTALATLGVEHHEHEPLLPRAWALRHNLTAYDAVYVVLAEALDVPLLTTDTRLAAAPGHRAAVEVLGPSADGPPE